MQSFHKRLDHHTKQRPFHWDVRQYRAIDGDKADELGDHRKPYGSFSKQVIGRNSLDTKLRGWVVLVSDCLHVTSDKRRASDHPNADWTAT